MKSQPTDVSTTPLHRVLDTTRQVSNVHLGGPVDAALADAVVAASNLLQDLILLTQVTHLAFQHLNK
jgi:hypothetical protein